MKKETETLEKVKWIPLREKLGCSDCKKTCYYKGSYHSSSPNSIIECQINKITKKFIFLKDWVSAIPIFFLFGKVFYMLPEGYFFLSISISLAILFAYDMIIIGIEKLVMRFFETLEKKRRSKYERELKRKKLFEEQEKQKKEYEEAKEKLYFKEVEMARKMYQELNELDDARAIKEQFFEKYQEMLKSLKEICDDLTPEEFFNTTVKNLFKIYLPELLRICQDFVIKYDKGILSSEEMVLFEKLLKTSKERFVKVRKVMWEQEKVDLYINMSALIETFSTSNEREDKNEK